MKLISETEHVRLVSGSLNRSKEWACSVSLPPANGLGLFVTLRRRERIADCAELILLHAAGNTSTKSASPPPIQPKDSGTLSGDATS